MFTQIRIAAVAFLTLTLLTGVAYPLVVTGIAKVAFSHQAEGSLIERGGKTVGSSLLGQPFDDPKYFWGRLSATSPYPYNASSSSGSNFGPSNPALVDAVKGRVDALHAADPTNTDLIPVDLVTASGSGLDPHISPASANYQIHRIARLRNVEASRVESLVRAHTESPQLGILGEARVNVLELNLELETL